MSRFNNDKVMPRYFAIAVVLTLIGFIIVGKALYIMTARKSYWMTVQEKLEQALARLYLTQFTAATPAPKDILTAAQRMIQEIIAVCNFVEHFAHRALHATNLEIYLAQATHKKQKRGLKSPREKFC